MKGYLITFEGPDGAGKTTVLNEVVKRLQDEDVLASEILMTREPGGSKISERIRQIILDPTNVKMSAETEALLYAAARSQHVKEVIEPALKLGQVVFSDRFVDSSLAYQGEGRHLGISAVQQINDFATGGLTPNLTLFLDISPQAGLARILKARVEDRLEQEKIAFHQTVYEGYQEVIKRHPDRIVVVDANAPLEKVVENSVKIIKNRLPHRFLINEG